MLEKQEQCQETGHPFYHIRRWRKAAPKETHTSNNQEPPKLVPITEKQLRVIK